MCQRSLVQLLQFSPNLVAKTKCIVSVIVCNQYGSDQIKDPCCVQARPSLTEGSKSCSLLAGASAVHRWSVKSSTTQVDHNITQRPKAYGQKKSPCITERLNQTQLAIACAFQKLDVRKYSLLNIARAGCDLPLSTWLMLSLVV